MKYLSDDGLYSSENESDVHCYEAALKLITQFEKKIDIPDGTRPFLISLLQQLLRDKMITIPLPYNHPSIFRVKPEIKRSKSFPGLKHF